MVGDSWTPIFNLLSIRLIQSLTDRCELVRDTLAKPRHHRAGEENIVLLCKQAVLLKSGNKAKLAIHGKVAYASSHYLKNTRWCIATSVGFAHELGIEVHGLID